jgi:large subunit ribosomal protein L2
MTVSIISKKPTSPGVRHQVYVSSSVVEKKPLKPKYLLRGLNKNSGRDNSGKITVRGKCRGTKKLYRIIDFFARPDSIDSVSVHVIESIQYDPNRNAHIALIKNQDTEKHSYVIATEGMKKGGKVTFTNDALKNINSGDSLKLKHIPIGSMVSSIEIRPGSGAVLARSAGSYCYIIGRENGYVSLRMPSGEIRKFLEDCRVRFGITSNKEYSNVVFGKAGKSYAKGFRPISRGIARNPVDHPMGGRTNGGKHPQSPTGVLAKGKKTRKKTKKSSFFIVKRRISKKSK